MKKNDKIIVVAGIIFLLIALVGIVSWEAEEPTRHLSSIDELITISGTFSQKPNAISVSDSDPFFALISTPLAVHYSENKDKYVVPMYIQNITNPSSAIVRAERNIGLRSTERIDDSMSAKQWSIYLAKKYWDTSEAVLILENNQSGYNLGVVAAPLASYLSIPIIVTDVIDRDIVDVFNELNVKKTIICGENLEVHGEVLRFTTVEEILENKTKLVKEKFGDINYIALTNPIDAFQPEVLNYTQIQFGPEKVKSASMIRQSTLGYAFGSVGEDYQAYWDFEIPQDYKYALVQFEGYNHELDGVDEFADYAEFTINPVERESIWTYVKTTNAVAQKDRAGNTIEDKLFLEMVFYDCGGDTFQIIGSGSWALLEEGRISATVTIKQLEHPVYEMMEGLSSIAPYLAAYYNGIVFAKTDFAFTADDDILTEAGSTSPGYYTAGRNIDLVSVSNKHIIDTIHQPLNELLKNIADIPAERRDDLEYLTNHYKINPIYIAIVGGTTAIPRYIYENDVGPIGYTGFQGFAGGGTPTDNIYGNIDPVKYDYSNMATDLYTTTGFPYIENIVGRVTGWDVQDANALILRSLFYEEMIDDLSGWKYNFGNLYGGGIDFRAPAGIMLLNRIPGIRGILRVITNLLNPTINVAVPPWKIDTGYSDIYAQAVEYEIGETLGFNVETAFHHEAMLEGFSDEAISKIKTATLWNRLTYSPSQIREYAGEGVVKGKEIMENSNLIWLTGHGSIYNLGLEGSDLVSSGTSFLRLNLWQKFYKRFISPYFMFGFWGPGSGHKGIGEYYPRLTSTLDMGPSLLWLESCFCGKISGVTPEANVGQGIIHAGVGGMIASTCGANIAGGYLPEKPAFADTDIGTWLRHKQWERKAAQDIYPDFHLGPKIYADMTSYLADGLSVGEALRNSRNQYLAEDEDWHLWWSPPLSSLSLGDEAPEPVLGYDNHMGPKHSSFNMYQLYGDPAFKPFIPINN